MYQSSGDILEASGDHLKMAKRTDAEDRQATLGLAHGVRRLRAGRQMARVSTSDVSSDTARWDISHDVVLTVGVANAVLSVASAPATGHCGRLGNAT